MAKKFGKIVLLTALASAAAAGGIALYNKYKASSEDFDDDFLDFDDEEDEDFDSTLDDTGREYVSIPREAANDTSEDSVVKNDNYNVNVDVSIDTSNFKEDEEDEKKEEEKDDTEDTDDDIFFEKEN